MSNVFSNFSTNEARDFHHMTSKRLVPTFLAGILGEFGVEFPKHGLIVGLLRSFHESIECGVNFPRLFGDGEHQPNKEADQEKCSGESNHTDVKSRRLKIKFSRPFWS